MINKTEKAGKPLKKAALKSIIALVLCMATIIGSIGARTNTASAASKKVPLTVTFKGKDLDLVTDLKNCKLVKTIDKVTKKWGKPSSKHSVGMDAREVNYTWKKGKSSIMFIDDNGDGKKVIDFYIIIKDKNASVYSVKVGMKKAQAIKKIENATGWKVRSHTQEGKKMLCVAPKHRNNGECKSQIRFYLKNGKVSSIESFNFY